MRKHKEISTLIIFCAAFCIINVVFYISMSNAGSGALNYIIIIYPIFWVISGIVLLSMIKLLKIKIYNIVRKVLVLFSTPLPFFIFFTINAFYQPPSPKIKYNNHGQQRKMEEIYFYRNGQIERKEFYKRNARFDWEKDSVWIYYDRKGNVIKTEQYHKTQ